MFIDVLVCHPDGTDEIERREVPDDWCDPPEPTAAQKIAALQARLTATDYKIIKCSEYQLAGLEPPYDVAALHDERQGLRDEINVLEQEVQANGEHCAGD